jgi:hypothetical protein
MASETSSLGCHNGPVESARASIQLAGATSWVGSADACAATSRRSSRNTDKPEWIARTGLPRNCSVLCGLHDSNAAACWLLAVTGEIRDHDATVLSTGTWIVAMRSPSSRGQVNPGALDEHRDCLINVDVAGSPVPSSRFMAVAKRS